MFFGKVIFKNDNALFFLFFFSSSFVFLYQASFFPYFCFVHAASGIIFPFII